MGASDRGPVPCAGAKCEAPFSTSGSTWFGNTCGPCLHSKESRGLLGTVNDVVKKKCSLSQHECHVQSRRQEVTQCSKMFV